MFWAPPSKTVCSHVKICDASNVFLKLCVLWQPCVYCQFKIPFRASGTWLCHCGLKMLLRSSRVCVKFVACAHLKKLTNTRSNHCLRRRTSAQQSKKQHIKRLNLKRLPSPRMLQNTQPERRIRHRKDERVLNEVGRQCFEAPTWPSIVQKGFSPYLV